MTTLRILITAFASLAIACGDPGVGGGTPPGDASAIGTLPTWRLEDIQPLSPRAGQTYGLSAFADHIVVVTLVAGF